MNDAGINRRNAFAADADAMVKDWQDTLAVNLDGVFNVTHAFLDPLRASKGRDHQHRVDPVIRARAHAELGGLHDLEARRARIYPRARGRARQGWRARQRDRPGFIETPLNASACATIRSW